LIDDLETKYGRLTFRYNEYEAELIMIKTDGNLVEVEIPETFLGKPVTSIGPNVTDARTLFKKITLPDTVKIIKRHSFRCTKIGELKLSNNLEVIEGLAFEKSTIKGTLNLPSSIKSIEKGAFSFANIERFEIPDCEAFSKKTKEEGAVFAFSSFDQVVVTEDSVNPRMNLLKFTNIKNLILRCHSNNFEIPKATISNVFFVQKITPERFENLSKNIIVKRNQDTRILAPNASTFKERFFDDNNTEGFHKREHFILVDFHQDLIDKFFLLKETFA